MKKLFLFICLLISCLLINAQKYYLKGGSIKGSDFEIQSASRSEAQKFVTVLINGRKTFLGPDDIEEYAVNGRTYRSQILKINDSDTTRVFMEKLVDGQISLFYYLDEFSKGKRFFLERFGALDELKSNNYEYKRQLNSYNQCDKKFETKHIRLNQFELSNFVQTINLCKENTSFLVSKFIFIGGYRNVFLSNTRELPGLSSRAFVFGFIGEFPTRIKSTSLNIGMNFSSMDFGPILISFDDILDYQVDFNFNTLNVPIYLKYSLPISYTFKPHFPARWCY